MPSLGSRKLRIISNVTRITSDPKIKITQIKDQIQLNKIISDPTRIHMIFNSVDRIFKFTD